MVESLRRVLVTGSRNWSEQRVVFDALDQQLAVSPNGIIVVVGDARGADSIAASWTKHPFHWSWLHVFKADWSAHGKAAGPIRNQQMVDSGVDVCLAFPLGESRGTRDCMRRAMKAGVQVIDYEWVLGIPE